MAWEVTVAERMKLRDGPWDGDRARREIYAWAENEDGSIDWAKAARGHTVADLDPPGEDGPTRGDLKAPIAYVEDGELVGIGNGIRNALARLDQIEGPSQAVLDDARSTLERMLEHLNKQGDTADVERSEEERAEIREKFPRLVNMTPSEMREWGESPFAGQNRKSGEARASARKALADVIRLKEKRMTDWTEADYDEAVEAIAFIERMSEGAQGDPLKVEGREGPSARDASLKDWGHDPNKGDVSDAERDDQAAFFESMKADGRVYRMSRVDLRVEPGTLEVIDRALAIADKVRERGDDVTMTAIVDGLRSDGVDKFLTQEGFLLMPVWAARTGSQLYGDGRSTWYEYRSPDEVEASCSTYALRPFTDDHPSEFVIPSNYTRYTKGSCGQDAMLAAPAEDGERYVRVSVLVGDYDTLAKIKRGLEADMRGEAGRDVGKLELSAGYTTVAVDDPGVDPVSGIRYQYRQTKIIINHLALVDRGRAGPLARFSMQIDGVAWELRDQAQSANTKDQDTVPDPKKDMLDPEVSAQLLQAVRAYIFPESEEAAEAALALIAEIASHDPETVAGILMPGEDNRGLYMEGMKEMDIEGVKAFMDEANAKAWTDRMAEATKNADAANSQISKMQGQLEALQATVDERNAKEEAMALDALRQKIADACPTLGKVWADKVEEGKFSLDATQMREAAILDLQPSSKPKIDARRGKAGFDAHVEGLFDGVMFAHKSGASTNDSAPNGKTPAPTLGTLDGLRLVGQAASTTTYGSRSN